MGEFRRPRSFDLTKAEGTMGALVAYTYACPASDQEKRMSNRKTWVLVAAVILIVVSAGVAYLMKAPAPKRELKRYPMTGVVLAVRRDVHQISVANDDIAGFMQPMVMDYSVKDVAALSGVKRGDEIHAILLSDGASQWFLEDVRVSPHR